jgi:hypothetical protein
MTLTAVIESRGHADSESSTHLADSVPFAAQDRYLSTLLGVPDPETSAYARFVLGYCPVCLSDDGWLLCADLDVGEQAVTWSRIGFDGEVFAADSGWEQRPLEPELGFTFEALAYVDTIEAERERARTEAPNEPASEGKRRGWFRKR